MKKIGSISTDKFLSLVFNILLRKFDTSSKKEMKMKEKTKFFGWKSTKKCLVSIHILRVVFLTLGLWYRQGLSSGYTGYTYAWVLWACSIDPWFRGVSMLQAIDMKGGLGGGLYSYSQNKYLGQTLDFVRNSVLHGNSLISIFQKIFLVLEKVLSRGGKGCVFHLVDIFHFVDIFWQHQRFTA